MTTKLTNLTVNGPIERQFAQDNTTTSGNTFGYQGGIVNIANSSTTIAAGTLVLPVASVSNVYINIDTLAVESLVGDVLGINALGLFQVTVNAAGDITKVKDLRTRLRKQ